MKLLLKKRTIILLLSLVFLLTGCMYPSDNQDVSGNVPYAEHIESIQKAVDAYQENSGGMLPIKTTELETDIYIKYPIDFSKLVPSYTEKIPSTAYEKGGIFQYVLVDVEENPTVKLVDLRAAERIRELNLRKNINNGYIPHKPEAIGNNVYEIDYKAMGFKDQITIKSPYSDTFLPLIVGGDGNFYVDYSIDLHRLLNEKEVDVKPGDDIRKLLVEISPVLPAYSLPYTVNENNEPVIMDW